MWTRSCTKWFLWLWPGGDGHTFWTLQKLKCWLFVSKTVWRWIKPKTQVGQKMQKVCNYLYACFVWWFLSIFIQKKQPFVPSFSSLGCSRVWSLFTSEEQRKVVLWNSWYFFHTAYASINIRQRCLCHWCRWWSGTKLQHFCLCFYCHQTSFFYKWDQKKCCV